MSELTKYHADLFWHCESCGGHEPAQTEYEHGDCEPCVECENGIARVVTLQEGAAIEQRFALSGATKNSREADILIDSFRCQTHALKAAITALSTQARSDGDE